MSPIPRRIGWLLMVLALAIGWGARGAGLSHFGPFPVAALALLVGGIGILLVFTDRMVRALYAQLARAAPPANGDQASPRVSMSDAASASTGDLPPHNTN